MNKILKKSDMQDSEPLIKKSRLLAARQTVMALIARWKKVMKPKQLKTETSFREAKDRDFRLPELC